MASCVKSGGWRLRAGFTFFELTVSLCLLAVLIAVLASSLLYFAELAEKAAVDLTIRNIRSGLRLEMARQIAEGKVPDIARLAAMNPVVWLESPPDGYGGEIRYAGAVALEKGKWYFDAERRELIYVPRFAFHFQASGAMAPRIHWRLEIRSSGTGKRAETWIEIEPAAYRWF